MDRELLIEIGCEEIPAGWLPALTRDLAARLDARLKQARLDTDAPAESYSTPRRLTARVAKLSERQNDHEELVTGPPVSAAFKAAGEPTAAATGFAKKYGVEVSALERSETPKGTYLAYRVRQRGKATVDVLADVMGGLLRDLTFPKQMRWDAYLEDGKGDLVFARPIRWLILLYGGRVVPFVIRRTENAQGPLVQDIRSGPNTYGHRFLTTSGRAGRAIKVKTFDDYQARLLENFVILDRSERESKIRRELETHARRLGGRVSGLVAAQSSLLQEVPDLVEYPAVIAGHFPVEFLQLPEEVLTTTMIHHQHYFPVVDEEGRLKPAFLAVTNMQPEKPEIIARNSERVLTARLRDARFFWDEDRKAMLESRIDRLSTILFHKKLGSYREKADRVAALAEWIAREAFHKPEAAADAARAGRLAKADLATDMVREFTDLQGTMGGIYAREEGQPETVWKAIYYQYLPVGVEADAPPSRQQLGAAAVTWAAVSLADKIDSVAGMFAGGERPTGSRDPLGLRRQAQGAVKILADLAELTGISTRIDLWDLMTQALASWAPADDVQQALRTFMRERVIYLFEQRGFDVRNIRAVVPQSLQRFDMIEARKKLEALVQMNRSEALRGVAELFKRVKNITKGVAIAPAMDAQLLKEAAEATLLQAMKETEPKIRAAAAHADYRQAFQTIELLRAPVAQFFDDVLVMAEDEKLRTARLALMARLRDLILEIADISEIVTES
ncbi:MAG TPA: glycine--tRNA ligase subunit beta [Vicinamibacterales bacterium]|nr:glycine--tRNA ligase subunit beta [Vicinamibacterales bacterium]